MGSWEAVGYVVIRRRGRDVNLDNFSRRAVVQRDLGTDLICFGLKSERFALKEKLAKATADRR